MVGIDRLLADMWLKKEVSDIVVRYLTDIRQTLNRQIFGKHKEVSEILLIHCRSS